MTILVRLITRITFFQKIVVILLVIVQVTFVRSSCGLIAVDAFAPIALNTCRRIGSSSRIQLIQSRISSHCYFSQRHPPLSLFFSTPINNDSDDVNDDDNNNDNGLQRTANHLKKLTGSRQQVSYQEPAHETMYQSYLIQPATSLKRELQNRQLPTKGRKPDLAQRLTDDDIQQQQQQPLYNDILPNSAVKQQQQQQPNGIEHGNDNSYGNAVITRFAGMSSLSPAASNALSRAKFIQSSAIQNVGIPTIVSGQSCILHAQTGSGKTLAYLLPITERLWSTSSSKNDGKNDNFFYAVIMTPTRELAAQVASIATTLAPPGTVRFISKPTNLLSIQHTNKERGEQMEVGGYLSDVNPDNCNFDVAYGTTSSRLYIGSANAIQQSLYGNSKLPASPTSKPEAMYFLKNVRYVVLDEIDRLLLGASSSGTKRSGSGSTGKKHDKPAAIVTAAITRLSYGKSQIVGASATVGRPLTRELARVLGLPPKECPPVVRDVDDDDSIDHDDSTPVATTKAVTASKVTKPTTRAVTLPRSVRNFVVPVGGMEQQQQGSPGKILTTAYQIIRSLNDNGTNDHLKVLLVLTRNFGLTTQNVIGALKHFNCHPAPQSLLDVLEADGTDNLIAVHQKVSGASGLGTSQVLPDPQYSTSLTNKNSPDSNSVSDNDNGYLLVTGEDTIRGLHLDGLDIVLIAGRPQGVDEYVHIAGRTGRAGKPGTAIVIAPESSSSSTDEASSSVSFVSSWEKMLDTNFIRILNPSDSRKMVMEEEKLSL